MQCRKITLIGLALIASAAVILMACSQKPVFQVNYALPQAPAAFPDKMVTVGTSDGRSTTQFLSSAAAREIKDFSGLFSLVVLKGENIGDLVGAYEIVPLMGALCAQRLNASSIKVAQDPAATLTRLEIVLKSFQLDYVKRKWIASMSYEAIASSPDGSIRMSIWESSPPLKVSVKARPGMLFPGVSRRWEFSWAVPSHILVWCRI